MKARLFDRRNAALSVFAAATTGLFAAYVPEAAYTRVKANLIEVQSWCPDRMCNTDVVSRFPPEVGAWLAMLAVTLGFSAGLAFVLKRAWR